MSDEPFWWPTNVDSLSVEETETGFAFLAEEGSECSAWLKYYNESEERRELFRKAIIAAVNRVLEEGEIS